MIMSLNNIRDNHGARSSKKRLGRGIGSGLGKTSGRGMKGQGARSGVSLNGFEGGQNPIYRRLPKRGFVNIHKQHLFELTFTCVERMVSSGALKAGGVIDRNLLIQSGIMKKWYDGISLIATGTLKTKLVFEVTRSSKAAQTMVEKLDGRVDFL